MSSKSALFATSLYVFDTAATKIRMLHNGAHILTAMPAAFALVVLRLLNQYFELCQFSSRSITSISQWLNGSR